MTTVFTKLLERHGVSYMVDQGHHHARPGWIQFDCPFCGTSSGKYHMGFREEGAYVNCWRCGRHDLLETLKVLTGLGYGDLKDDLVALRSRTARLPHLDAERLVGPELILPRGIGALRRPHREYLRSRGFNPRLLAKVWGVRGIGCEGGRLAWRVFIPIYQGGVMVSWTTRSIGRAEPRYISARGNQELVDHRSILFGEDMCRHAVIVVEGPFDVIRIGPGAAACLGTGISRDHLVKLSRYPVRVVCLDSEPVAQRKARELVNLLSVFPGDTYNVVLDAKDPAEASDREIRRLRKEFLE